jgi:AcrR family transcriptional regulator
MGRRQTIDRGHLLDAAEQVVLRDGPSSLTIDAVAKEAGVSKGGVLYAYSTKDALIEAMMARVVANYERMVAEYMAAAGDRPNAAVLAHVDANRREEASENARAIALMASFIRAPEYHASSVAFYRELFAHADMTTEAGRRIRLALLATEGAFVLRGFGLHPFSDADWQAIHEDIVAILLA